MGRESSVSRHKVPAACSHADEGACSLMAVGMTFTKETFCLPSMEENPANLLPGHAVAYPDQRSASKKVDEPHNQAIVFYYRFLYQHGFCTVTGLCANHRRRIARQPVTDVEDVATSSG